MPVVPLPLPFDDDCPLCRFALHHTDHLPADRVRVGADFGDDS